ncbi:ATP-binding protein [Treponema zioleckii]|uniref:ATP-binding protein n=1 Tax=Treponema zioleckii TaxID=331680 RepID=UPI00168A8B9A|nr:ATP-binding protein [Treponema zioleckii]
MLLQKILATLCLLASGCAFAEPLGVSSFLSEESAKIGGGYAVTKQISGVGYTCELYDASNGLPTSDANYIMSASDGSIWICGYSGVIRYDGTVFERLPATNGLTSGRVLFQDSKNRIWIGTNDNGAVMLSDEKMRHFTYKDGLTSSSVRGFAEDWQGNIFIATTAGLAYVNPNALLYRLPDKRLNEETILKLDSDSKGTVYGITKKGVVFAIENMRTKAVYKSSDISSELITTLMADPKEAGKVYLCTSLGSVYHGKFGQRTSEMERIDVTALGHINSISYNCDRIWISSASSIGYLDESNVFVPVPDILLHSSIEMITADYQGNIWMCSSRQGVMKIVADNFLNLTKAAGLPSETVNATCLHDGLLYAGCDTGLRIIDKENHAVQNALSAYIGNSRIRSLLEDRKGNLWVATYTNALGLVCFSRDGQISSFTKKEGMLNNEIRCIAEAFDGSIVCGTNDGLAIIKDGIVVRTLSTQDGIKNTVILTVEEDRGTVYAGSDGDGIYMIDLRSSEIRRIGREAGLTSDVVMRIKKDNKRGIFWLVTSNSLQYMKDGVVKEISTFPYNNNYDLYINGHDDVWVLSSYGIYAVSAKDLLLDKVEDFQLYTIANGLPSAITGNSFSVLDADGVLYIACREGVTRVNINHYFAQNAEIKASLSAVYCGEQKISPDANGTFTLPSSKDRIRFVASVMDYTMANPLVHLFLEGADDEGITASRKSLPPLEYIGLFYGKYTFHIQVLDHSKKHVLFDRTFDIIKKPRIFEILLVRIILFSLLVGGACVIVWRIMKSTVIARQYTLIRTAREDAEQANRAKARFLSNMSQEIITPINTIMCMDEMILRENAKDVPKHYFLSMTNYGMNIHRAADSLLTLVNDLLEMSKIESGKFSLSESEYNVKALLRSVVIPIRLKSAEKKLVFDVSVDPLLPSRLYGDVGKIKQILLNLLTNAVKYTDEGSFSLTVSMESRTNDRCDLCIYVKDTGKGIKLEEVEGLFDAYGLVEKKVNETHAKIGLGLDISRKFAELMGGVLVCKSELGKGSEFIFTLSQKIVDQTPAGIFTEADERAVRGPYIPQFIAPDADVLVASENPVTRAVIESLLKATKVFVTTAKNRQNFIDKIRENSFNIAFIDQQFFEHDEEKLSALSAKIKQFSPSLPVYIFTEDATESESHYIENGFKGTLPLPVDSGLLERTIMRSLPREMMEIPDLRELIADLSELPENFRWLYKIKDISVEEGIKNSGSIGHFVFSVQLFYDTIESYTNDIEEAYRAGDFELYRAKNGIMRTSAHVVGAMSLFELSSKIEEAFGQSDKLFVSSHTDELLSLCRTIKEELSPLSQEGRKNGEEHV